MAISSVSGISNPILDIISEELSDRKTSLNDILDQGATLGSSSASGLEAINSYSTRLFGSPFQLLNSVDRRFESLNPMIGNEFLRNFTMDSAILSIRPGMPLYTGGQTSTIKQFINEALLGESVDSDSRNNLMRMLAASTIFSPGKKLERRLFGFRQTYWRYIQSVNYMCRTAAVYLGLMNAPVFTGYNESHTLGTMDWGNYRFISSEKYLSPGDIFAGESLTWGNIYGSALEEATIELNRNLNDDNYEDHINALTGLSNRAQKRFDDLYNSKGTISQYANDFLNMPSTVQFMCDPTMFTESFRNETGESIIAQTIDALDQGIGSEIAFITGSTADVGVLGDAMKFLGDTIGAATTNLSSLVSPVTGGFVHNLVSGGLRSLKGQKMIYPDIYKKSDVQMNYSFTIKLRAAYGDRYNYYMEILVPLFHLICLAMPRLVSSNSSTSPFLCQAYIPGMCSINLGIIEDLQIEKNPDGNHVSVEGFPLSVDVRISIRDLYQGMAISPADDPASFLYNQSLTEYLMTSCGLDNSISTKRQTKSVQMDAISDFFTPANLFSSAMEPLLGSAIDWFYTQN